MHNLIIREAITFTVVSRGVMQPSHVAHLALEAQMQSVVLGNIATLMFLAIPMKLCIYPYNRFTFIKVLRNKRIRCRRELLATM